MLSSTRPSNKKSGIYIGVLAGNWSQLIWFKQRDFNTGTRWQMCGKGGGNQQGMSRHRREHPGKASSWVAEKVKRKKFCCWKLENQIWAIEEDKAEGVVVVKVPEEQWKEIVKKYADSSSVILFYLHLTHLNGQIESDASWLRQDDVILRGLLLWHRKGV